MDHDDGSRRVTPPIQLVKMGLYKLYKLYKLVVLSTSITMLQMVERLSQWSGPVVSVDGYDCRSHFET